LVENATDEEFLRMFALGGPDRAADLLMLRAKAKKGGGRRIIKGADGHQYYPDTGERVLPGVQAPPEGPGQRRIIKGADGHQYYPDTGERVLPDVQAPPEGPGIDVTGEGVFRREFAGLVKGFRTVHNAFGRIQASAANPDGVGDVALLFNYMKMLDPASVVRESEFATAENAGGVAESIRNVYNRLINGGRLTDDLRASFVDRSRRLYEAARSSAEELAEDYRTIAPHYGYDPKRVVWLPDAPPPPSTPPTQTIPVAQQPEAAPAQPTTQPADEAQLQANIDMLERLRKMNPQAVMEWLRNNQEAAEQVLNHLDSEAAKGGGGERHSGFR
jgi:hypothetical protein